MRKKGFIFIICSIILIGGYYIFFYHTKINIDDVESIKINDVIYDRDNDNDAIVVMEIVSLYNEGRRFRKDVGTTPSHMIVIQLKNGKKIEVSGTTQGFHYVTIGRQSYKISSDGLTIYLRNKMYLRSNREN